MNAQAQAIVTLFESLPEKDQEQVYSLIGSRFVLNPKKASPYQRHRSKVLEVAKRINLNTPINS
tara:strand:+ start:5129 stop:5320 length:192 start_codon:yes stop_codon:yes gene_type:complete